MTATHPSITQPLGSIPGMTPTMPPPAPYFPRKFWIAPEGKSVEADEDEVQILVDAGLVNLDIQSQDPGSAWTKPAALGFTAKTPSPVPPPTPAVPVQPPAPFTDWPTPATAPTDASTVAEPSVPAQPEILGSAPPTPRPSPRVSKKPVTPAQPFVFAEFAKWLTTCSASGTKFRLASGDEMASPILEAGVPITADTVRQALVQVEKEYKQRGLAPEFMSLAEIQENAVVLAAVLNFQAKLSGGPVSRHLKEFGTAVVDFQHTLHILIHSEKD